MKVAGERRVSDVLVNGDPLDPEKTYTITTLEFLLTGGDHFTMFKDDAKITDTTHMTDNALLAEYIEKNLNGVIPEKYRQAEGRIHVTE
jgi:2',3'-cyclic-nucleotide 2'-phosphodiesterase (5'-nucleotidase family)